MQPSEINIDQTIAYAADQFEIALNGSDAFLAQPSFATVDLGFLDELLAPQLVNAIKNAVVDEVELHVSSNKMTSVLRGRDAAARAVDSTVFVTYSVGQSQVPVFPTPTSVPGFPTLPVTPGVTVPTVLPGPWTARRVVEDLCARVGLGCSYNAPDYALREDVSVNGPVLSAIQSLVSPFSQFERSKVDAWLEQSTLVIRSRGAGGPGISLDMQDARISNILVRARFLGYIGVVRLTGASELAASSDFAAVDPGAVTSETTDEMIDPDTGDIVSRVVTQETKRALDGAVLSQVIETYKDLQDGHGLSIVSSVETTSNWDDLQLAFPNQVVNSPKERLRTTVTSSRRDPDFPTLEPTHRTKVIHSYDGNGFLSAQETVDEDFDADATPPGFAVVSTETKQYRPNGPGMYQITSTQYGADGSPGAVRRTTALGTPPGGPGRSTGSGAAAAAERVTLAGVVSTQPGAKDVSITDASLLLDHLSLIMQQAEAASGATEFEVSFTAAGVPWLHRGQYVHLTNLFAEDGVTPITLQNALVSEVKTEYRESRSDPTNTSSVRMPYTSFVRMLYWLP